MNHLTESFSKKCKGNQVMFDISSMFVLFIHFLKVSLISPRLANKHKIMQGRLWLETYYVYLDILDVPSKIGQEDWYF